MLKEQVNELRSLVVKLYSEQPYRKVPFHDLPHVLFVSARAAEFASRNGANVELVTAAALLHDLNYLVDPRSGVAAGCDMRAALLTQVNVAPKEIPVVETIVRSADIEYERDDLTGEARALSDADTLYKILPITPILFSRDLLDESDVSIRALAEKICRTQRYRFETDTLFFDAEAKVRYRAWAMANLELWEKVMECLEEPDIASLAIRGP